MMTKIDAETLHTPLSFLVELSRMDGQLSPGDRLKQREDVAGFLEAAAPALLTSPAKRDELRAWLTDSELDDMRNKAEAVLTHVVAGYDFERTGLWAPTGRIASRIPQGKGAQAAPLTQPRGLDVKLAEPLTVRVSIADGAPRFTIATEGMRDVFHWRILEALQEPIARQLRVCPFCQKVFLKQGRGERCTRKCTNDFHNRNRPPRTRDQRRPEREREYRKTLRLSSGAKVQVGKNARPTAGRAR